MATTLTKALFGIGIGGSIAGVATAGALMLPNSIAQELKKDGYHLISEIEETKKDILFKAKWEKYKVETNKSNIFSKGDENKTISEPNFIKLCTDYENSSDISFKDRVIKWCTLNIEDQIVTIENKKYIDKEKSNEAWTNKYNKIKANNRINQLIGVTGDRDDQTGQKLHKWCADNKEKEYFKDTQEILNNSKTACLTEDLD